MEKLDASSFSWTFSVNDPLRAANANCCDRFPKVHQETDRGPIFIKMFAEQIQKCPNLP